MWTNINLHEGSGFQLSNPATFALWLPTLAAFQATNLSFAEQNPDKVCWWTQRSHLASLWPPKGLSAWLLPLYEPIHQLLFSPSVLLPFDEKEILILPKIYINGKKQNIFNCNIMSLTRSDRSTSHFKSFNKPLKTTLVAIGWYKIQSGSERIDNKKKINQKHRLRLEQLSNYFKWKNP